MFYQSCFCRRLICWKVFFSPSHYTTAPDTPTVLQAVNVTDTKALLVWKPTQAKVDRYILSYGSSKCEFITCTRPGQGQLWGCNAISYWQANWIANWLAMRLLRNRVQPRQGHLDLSGLRLFNDPSTTAPSITTTTNDKQHQQYYFSFQIHLALSLIWDLKLFSDQ